MPVLLASDARNYTRYRIKPKYMLFRHTRPQSSNMLMLWMIIMYNIHINDVQSVGHSLQPCATSSLSDSDFQSSFNRTLDLIYRYSRQSHSLLQSVQSSKVSTNTSYHQEIMTYFLLKQTICLFYLS